MPTASNASRRYDLLRAVATFLMAHPYSFYRRAGRYYSNDAFRRRLRELRQQYVDLDLDDFAATLQVPRDTLREVLAPGADRGLAEPGERAPTREPSTRTGS